MKTANMPNVTPGWIGASTDEPFGEAELCQSLGIWLDRAKVIACAITDSQSEDPQEMKEAGYMLFCQIVEAKQLLDWYEQARARKLKAVGGEL